jgi:hypothetical protein
MGTPPTFSCFGLLVMEPPLRKAAHWSLPKYQAPISGVKFQVAARTLTSASLTQSLSSVTGLSRSKARMFSCIFIPTSTSSALNMRSRRDRLGTTWRPTQ